MSDDQPREPLNFAMLSKSDLVTKLMEVEDELGEARKFIEAAKAHYQVHGVRLDPLEFKRAKDRAIDLERARRHLQHELRVKHSYERKLRSRGATVLKQFIEIAKRRLAPDIFDMLLAEARDKAKELDGE